MQIKNTLKRFGNYIIERINSDEYYDHELYAKLKFKAKVFYHFHFVKKATMFQHIPYCDDIVSVEKRCAIPQDILKFPDNTMFLRKHNKRVVDVYYLKKKNDRLGYLYSQYDEPLEVRM